MRFSDDGKPQSGAPNRIEQHEEDVQQRFHPSVADPKPVECQYGCEKIRLSSENIVSQPLFLVVRELSNRLPRLRSVFNMNAGHRRPW